jgi:hypothetical protein
MELVRLFREKCMSKEIARYSGIGGTMVEAWAEKTKHEGTVLLLQSVSFKFENTPR